MKTTARAVLTAALLSLTACPAFAQCTSMPANSVCGRLAIPPAGGSAVAIPFPAFSNALLGAGLSTLRVTGAQVYTTGFGLELGYDGTEGFIQSYSNRSNNTLSPIFYIAASHKFTGLVSIGPATTPTASFIVEPAIQTSSNSRVFSISSDQNAAVTGAPGPIQLTWGASAGSVWDASPSGGNIGGNANLFTTTMFAKQDTFDAVAWQTYAHLSAGTSAAIVGTRVQTFIDNTATTPRGGTGLEVSMTSNATVGDIWGAVIGVNYAASTTTGNLTGTEYDLSATTAIKSKTGVVVASTQIDTATVSGTISVNGFADTIPASVGLWVSAFGGGSASGFDQALRTVQETASAKPVTGRLWYAGGFSVPTGLDWGRMTFSTQAMLLPNNAPIRAYAADNTTIFSLINLNTSNLIAFGGGATIHPTSGAGAFGGSTLTNATMNGTAGGGYLQLNTQSSKPSTPTLSARLYADTSSRFTFEAADGFARAFSGTLTADRVYTYLDKSYTLADAANTRSVLSGNTTYFVRTDGNDSNSGLVNSSGGAFLTLQRAANIVYNTLDLAGFNVTVSVGAGTYTGGVSITVPQVGMGTVTFQGDTGTPSNVVVSTTSASAFSVTNAAAVTITGFKLQTTTSGNCISADMGAQVTTGIIQYGVSAGDHFVSANEAVGYINGNEQIRGGASAHWHAGNGGQVQVGGINIDAASGAYAFAAEFAGVSVNGMVFVLTGTNFTNTGSITGQRYLAHTGGVIITQSVSSSDTFLPGNALGTAFDGGFYNSTQFNTGMDVPATIRATGAAATNVATGIGLELGWDGTQGFIQAFDRSGSVFKPLLYTAATSQTFKIGATTVMALSASNIIAPLGINFGGDTLVNYIASTAWTPADGSGAALTFTNVNAHYTRMGNMVFAYGRLTYPATANGSNAVISGLPITSANATYATAPCSFYSASGSTNSLNATVAQNATTIGVFKNDGSASTNANLTGATLLFQCIYPAT